MAKIKKTEGAKFVKKTPKKRPGRHSKPRGMKSAFTGKHPR
jgi:hypothetical protein